VTDTTTLAEPVADGGPDRRSRRVLIGLGLVVLLIAGTAIAVRLSRTDRAAPAPHGLPHLVGGAADGRTDGTLQVLSGATAVTVRARDLGGQLYRITTPDDAGTVPVVHDTQGTLQVQLVSSGGGSSSSTVEVLLDAAVRWQVDLVGGVTDASVDLSAGLAGGIRVSGGATLVEVTLPRPVGTVELRVTQGVGTLEVRRPLGVPTRVRVGGGAGSVTVDDASRSGVPSGSTLSSGPWEQATDRYDIGLDSGASAVHVQTG
jgi:hypothetical protein